MSTAIANLRHEQQQQSMTNEITIQQHAFPRKEIDQNVEYCVRNECIYVHGTDFLSEKDILDYFKQCNPLKVEWINDSSCNVVFSSQEEARFALMNLTLLIDGNNKEKENLLRFRKCFQFSREGKPFQFNIRLATNLDKKEATTKGSDSKYYEYIRKKTREQKMKHVLPNKPLQTENRENNSASCNDNNNDIQRLPNLATNMNSHNEQYNHFKKKINNQSNFVPPFGNGKSFGNNMPPRIGKHITKGNYGPQYQHQNHHQQNQIFSKHMPMNENNFGVPMRSNFKIPMDFDNQNQSSYPQILDKINNLQYDYDLQE